MKHFPAVGDATLSGVIVDCDLETGLASKIKSYIYGNLLNKKFLIYGRSFSLGRY